MGTGVTNEGDSEGSFLFKTRPEYKKNEPSLTPCSPSLCNRRLVIIV
jgi:hypothetical protein